MTPIEIFSHHADGIQAALDSCSDPRSVRDVARAIVNEEAQIWGDKQALIITELLRPYVHFWIATGELQHVIDLSHRVMEWARDLGYTKASLTGRKGWLRALATDGWRDQAVLMERTL